MIMWWTSERKTQMVKGSTGKRNETRKCNIFPNFLKNLNLKNGKKSLRQDTCHCLYIMSYAKSAK